MSRGGCSTCFKGGSSGSSLLIILSVLGIFLILLGLIVYNKDILDVSIQPVSKSQMNNYIGYTLIISGTAVLFIVGITRSHHSSVY
jgi:hypothetical protein